MIMISCVKLVNVARNDQGLTQPDGADILHSHTLNSSQFVQEHLFSTQYELLLLLEELGYPLWFRCFLALRCPRK